jgi:type I restriction enzyme S subunit
VTTMRWPMIALGDVARPIVRAEVPDPDKTYRLIGVRWWGEGAYQHSQKSGAETQAPALFRVQAGDIVINKIWARHGSVSVIQAELDGAHGSAEFPTFRADEAQLSPHWIRWWSRSPQCWTACSDGSFGSSGKNRIRPEQFLSITIPLPPLDEQCRIAARLDAVSARLKARAEAAERQEAELAAMLQQAFARITAGSPRARMADVAPLVRREVTIEPETLYTEIGIRSFFRGMFPRRTMAGAEFTWQSLYRVEAGDVVFSNLMAWERGIALAGAADEGCVGNHRMLTCAPDRARLLPGFLFFYFTTRKGFSQVEAASPGSIARNKTLSPQGLAAIEVPLPSLDAQRWFETLRLKADAIRSLNAAAAEDAAALLPAMLHEIFGQTAC